MKYLIILISVGFILTGCDARLNFMRPPDVIKEPDQSHRLSSRKFQGIPSLAISPKGKLWVTWYAGSNPKEDHTNYVVVASSSNGGKTFEEKHIIEPDGAGPVRAFDPELWVSPDGVLWSFWAQTVEFDGTIAGVWAMTNNDPDNEESRWTNPRRLTDGVMMCKPTVLSSGEWLLPVSTWMNTDNSAKVYMSMNKGKTWTLQGASNIPKNDRNFDEHMIVEKNDKSLWMLVRTLYGIGESFSEDKGETWSALGPATILHPPARFFIRRLHSGNLLLVKHGPIDKKIGRSNLTAYLSSDDGETWSGGLVLDDRSGISYPDGEQNHDGVIHIVYDHDRWGAREILMAKFTEKDVIEGRPVSGSASLRLVVSKYPEVPRKIGTVK